MTLFGDGNISSLEDLRAQESSILDVASSEGIDLGSKLTLAQHEISIELDEFLRRNLPDPNAASVDNVAATEPLRRWHCLRALALAFRDAYHNQLNDRYQGKYECYSKLALEARCQTFSRGIGIIRNPVHSTDPEATGEGQSPDYYVTANRRLRRG